MHVLFFAVYLTAKAAMKYGMDGLITGRVCAIAFWFRLSDVSLFNRTCTRDADGRDVGGNVQQSTCESACEACEAL